MIQIAKAKTTTHSLIFALSNTLSNLILYVDSGDITYNEALTVTLEEVEEELTEHPKKVLKLKVRKGNEVLTDAQL